jgi:glycosyltransferase involved in cell wall biosynthesis
VIHVSVIVPTRNRARAIQVLIESLWQQTFPSDRMEIIVVDNQSSDNSRQIIEGLIPASPCRLTFVSMEINRGPVHSRNTGARLAQGEVLAFTDSDCRADPEWLTRSAAAFEDPNVAFVSGAVLDDPLHASGFFTFRNGAVPGSENFSYPGCNLLFRKTPFVQFNGFNEGEWTGDVGDKPVECADTDLAWRMRKAGLRNVYVDQAIVYHEVTRQRPWQWLKGQTRVVMVTMAIRLHPELRDKLCWKAPFFRREHLYFYLMLAGFITASVTPAALVMTVPYLWYTLTLGGFRWSPLAWPRIAARTAALTVRQAVICTSLVYGSWRNRTFVL